MGKIFFIGDTHFDDEDIIQYENRPFKNVHIMNDTMIEAWNHTVSDDDIVYHLGDFSKDADPSRNIEILRKLNGEKHLILGNHDCDYKAKDWMKMGFEMAYEVPIIVEGFFILSHKPLYINRNMTAYANIFADVHKNPNYKDHSAFGYCVSTERLFYEPIDLDKIKRWIKIHRGSEGIDMN